MGPSKDTKDSLVQKAEAATDARVEKKEISPEEKTMLEFARRKIDDAVKVIYPLVKGGKLTDEDFYLCEAEDPEVKTTIDKVHEDLDYDSDMLTIVMDLIKELREKSETESDLISFAKRITDIHYSHQPRMSYDIDKPERRLEVGIKNRDIDNIVSALRSMVFKSMIAFSAMEIDRLIALVAKKDKAELFFSTIDQYLYELDDRAQHLAS